MIKYIWWYEMKRVRILVLIWSKSEIISYGKKGDNSDRKEIINIGLWKYSRHPNYFGEICFWYGVAFTYIFNDFSSNWFTIIGALLNNALFLGISIPLAEKNLKTYKEGFEEYKKYVPEICEYYTSFFSEEDKKKVNEFMESQPDEEEIWKQTEFLNEYIFRICTVAQAEKISKRGGNVYMYFWTFPSDKPNFGACHAVELSSIFNNLKNGIYTGGKVNDTLAQMAQLMWVNFAKTGDPSTSSIKWNKFNLKERKTMILGEEIKEESDNYPERNEKLIQIAKYYLNQL